MTNTVNSFSTAFSDAQYFESGMISPEELRRQLDSSSLRDKLEAMKRIVALISLGKDASLFFPEVVKNVASSSVELKKLVYLYLEHYAETNPDLALLSVNSFQKDLTDSNQSIRALALRVLSSIRVATILQVVLWAIKKCVKDSSPYVRRASAFAMIKAYEMDSSIVEDLQSSFEILMNDKSTTVIGAALLVWKEVFLYRYELLHRHYRKICRLLVDMDEWSQVCGLQILMLYAREHFPRPKNFHAHSNENQVFYSNEALEKQPIDNVFSSKDENEEQIDEDLLTLLKNSEYLFLSRNSAVVLSSVSLFFHLAPYQMFLEKAIEPLVRLLSSPYDIQIIVLQYIFVIVTIEPNSFLPYLSCFFLSERDPQYIRDWKLRIIKAMVLKATVESLEPYVPTLMMELRYYLRREEKAIAHSVTEMVGVLGERSTSWSSLCVELLSKTASHSTSNTVVSKAMSVLRHLIQIQPTEHSQVLSYLCCQLMESNMMASTAKAHIIWLVGEYRDLLPYKMPIELFRIFCTLFVNESNEVKLQTMNLGAKLLASCSKSRETQHKEHEKVFVSVDVDYYDFCKQLLTYVVQIAKYDSDYDVRDEARLLEVLMLNEENSSLYKMTTQIITMTKPASSFLRYEESLFVEKEEWRENGPILGSFSHIFDGKVTSDIFLPNWSNVSKGKELRAEELSQQQPSSSRPEYVMRKSSQSMERFYGSESSSISEEYSTDDQSSTSENEESGSCSSAEGSISDSSNATAEETISKGTTNIMMETEKIGSSSYPLNNLSLLETLDEQSIISEEPANKRNAEWKGTQVDLVSELSSMWPASSNGSLATKTKKYWKRLVDSWNCGGIEIDYYVSEHASVYGSDVGIVCLLMKNTNSFPVANIQLLPKQSSDEEQVPELWSSEEAFNLKENENKEFAIHVKFKGRPDQLPLELDCNLGRFPLNFRFTVGEILRPEVLSISEFEKKRSLMGGMLQMESRIYLQETRRMKDDRALEELVHTTIVCSTNFARVTCGKQESQLQENTLYYSARIRGNEKLLLMSLSWKASDWKGGIHLVLNTEDIVIGSNLLQFLKRQMETVVNELAEYGK